MLHESKLWVEDLDKTIYALPLLDELAGHSVMITGVTGLVCSAVADLLIRYNETHDTPIQIIAAARSEHKVHARFGEYRDRDYFFFIEYDANAPEFECPFVADYIIHGAGNSSPDMLVKEPVETMRSNFIGLLALLHYAKRNDTKRVLYISTSEVYGRKDTPEPYAEGQHGYIDILNPRSAYSIGKCASETLCASYLAEYGVETVIARPGHIYGPTMQDGDRHVAAAWAMDAAQGRDLVMKSDGAQIRSYVYCLDCAAALLTMLVKGQPGRAYNISNPDSVISIRQMAELLSKTVGVNLQIAAPTDSEKKGFNPMQNSSLNSEALMALGWRGLFDAETGFGHTVEILRDR